MTPEKVKDFFFKNIGYFVIALACVIYVASAILKIDETGKTVGQCIADGAIVFVIGFLINRVFDLQGILNGDRNERVVKTLQVHGETVAKVSPFIDELDGWCRMKNDENLKTQRMRILVQEGMRYESYFNEDGSAKEFTIDRKKLKDKFLRRGEVRRILCFKKALHCKPTPISAGDLTSEGNKRKTDPYYFGRSKSEYEKQTSMKDIVSKVIIAIIFGYYTVRAIEDFNVQVFIWNCVQVGIFLLMGVTKMIRSYIFVVDEYRGRVVKKINNLEMFYNYVQKENKEEKKEDDIQNEVPRE